MASEILVNTGSGNGLLPDGTKPLSESMLTYHRWDPLALLQGNVYLNTQAINNHIVFEIYTFEITATSPGRLCVNSLLLGNLNENSDKSFSS